MVMGYWSVAILFWQLSIDHIVNVLYKDVDLPRHAWDTPPFLLIVSPTPPAQSVDAYVHMYVRSVNNVTTKRKEVDHIPWVWGSIPRALRACGIPAINASPSEAITELVKTNYQMKLRHKETKHLLIGIRNNSKLLLHLTKLTIENIREIRLDKSEGGWNTNWWLHWH